MGELWLLSCRLGRQQLYYRAPSLFILFFWQRYCNIRFPIPQEDIARLKRGKIYLRMVGYTMELEPDNPLRNISDDPEEAMKSFDEYLRYLSLAYVDCFIAILQRDYARVNASYWELKRKLQGFS